MVRDAILEFAGIGTTLNQAIAVSRKCAEIIVVGVYAEPPRVNVLAIQEKQLRVNGVLMYTEENFREAVQMMAEGHYRLEPLMTRHFPLEQNQQAYQFIREHPDSCMEVLIDVADLQFSSGRTIGGSSPGTGTGTVRANHGYNGRSDARAAGRNRTSKAEQKG